MSTFSKILVILLLIYVAIHGAFTWVVPFPDQAQKIVEFIWFFGGGLLVIYLAIKSDLLE